MTGSTEINLNREQLHTAAEHLRKGGDALKKNYETIKGPLSPWCKDPVTSHFAEFLDKQRAAVYNAASVASTYLQNGGTELLNASDIITEGVHHSANSIGKSYSRFGTGIQHFSEHVGNINRALSSPELPQQPQFHPPEVSTSDIIALVKHIESYDNEAYFKDQLSFLRSDDCCSDTNIAVKSSQSCLSDQKMDGIDKLNSSTQQMGSWLEHTLAHVTSIYRDNLDTAFTKFQDLVKGLPKSSELEQARTEYENAQSQYNNGEVEYDEVLKKKQHFEELKNIARAKYKEYGSTHFTSGAESHPGMTAPAIASHDSGGSSGTPAAPPATGESSLGDNTPIEHIKPTHNNGAGTPSPTQGAPAGGAPAGGQQGNTGERSEGDDKGEGEEKSQEQQQQTPNPQTTNGTPGSPLHHSLSTAGSHGGHGIGAGAGGGGGAGAGGTSSLSRPSVPHGSPAGAMPGSTTTQVASTVNNSSNNTGTGRGTGMMNQGAKAGGEEKTRQRRWIENNVDSVLYGTGEDHENWAEEAHNTSIADGQAGGPPPRNTNQTTTPAHLRTPAASTPSNDTPTPPHKRPTR